MISIKSLNGNTITNTSASMNMLPKKIIAFINFPISQINIICLSPLFLFLELGIYFVTDVKDKKNGKNKADYNHHP